MGSPGSSILFLGAATLECCHPRWTCPRSTHNRCGTRWHRTIDCQHHTSATPFLAINLPCDITTVLNHHLQGALEWWQQTSANSAPASQHSMPKRKSPSAALGTLPSTKAEDPLGLEGTGSAIPDPMATSLQASLAGVMPQCIPSTFQVSHSPSLHAIYVASISPCPQS